MSSTIYAGCKRGANVNVTAHRIGVYSTLLLMLRLLIAGKLGSLTVVQFVISHRGIDYRISLSATQKKDSSMSNWTEQDANKMRHELENIYMLARRKRAVVHRYPPGWQIEGPLMIGPKSDDADWDHVIRFCEQAGLRPTILRAMETEGPAPG